MIFNLPKANTIEYLTKDNLRFTGVRNVVPHNSPSIDIRSERGRFQLNINGKETLLELKEIIDFVLEDNESMKELEEQK